MEEKLQEILPRLAAEVCGPQSGVDLSQMQPIIEDAVGKALELRLPPMVNFSATPGDLWRYPWNNDVHASTPFPNEDYEENFLNQWARNKNQDNLKLKIPNTGARVRRQMDFAGALRTRDKRRAKPNQTEPRRKDKLNPAVKSGGPKKQSVSERLTGMKLLVLPPQDRGDVVRTMEVKDLHPKSYRVVEYSAVHFRCCTTDCGGR